MADVKKVSSESAGLDAAKDQQYNSVNEEQFDEAFQNAQHEVKPTAQEVLDQAKANNQLNIDEPKGADNYKHAVRMQEKLDSIQVEGNETAQELEERVGIDLNGDSFVGSTPSQETMDKIDQANLNTEALETGGFFRVELNINNDFGPSILGQDLLVRNRKNVFSYDFMGESPIKENLRTEGVIARKGKPTIGVFDKGNPDLVNIEDNSAIARFGGVTGPVAYGVTGYVSKQGGVGLIADVGTGYGIGIVGAKVGPEGRIHANLPNPVNSFRESRQFLDNQSYLNTGAAEKAYHEIKATDNGVLESLGINNAQDFRNVVAYDSMRTGNTALTTIEQYSDNITQAQEAVDISFENGFQGSVEDVVFAHRPAQKPATFEQNQIDRTRLEDLKQEYLEKFSSPIDFTVDIEDASLEQADLRTEERNQLAQDIYDLEAKIEADNLELAKGVQIPASRPTAEELSKSNELSIAKEQLADVNNQLEQLELAPAGVNYYSDRISLNAQKAELEKNIEGLEEDVKTFEARLARDIDYQDVTQEVELQAFQDIHNNTYFEDPQTGKQYGVFRENTDGSVELLELNQPAQKVHTPMAKPDLPSHIPAMKPELTPQQQYEYNRGFSPDVANYISEARANGDMRLADEIASEFYGVEDTPEEVEVQETNSNNRLYDDSLYDDRINDTTSVVEQRDFDMFANEAERDKAKTDPDGANKDFQARQNKQSDDFFNGIDNFFSGGDEQTETTTENDTTDTTANTKTDDVYGPTQPDDNDDNDNDRGGCFISSACVYSKGLPDDCNELMILRSFRDNYMLTNDRYKGLVKDYYQLAPSIVKGIDKSMDRQKVYDEIYEKMLMPCITMISQEKYDEAVYFYHNYTRKLEKSFLKD